MAGKAGWLDRTIGAVSPRWQLQRERNRVAAELLRRHYEGAASGRRTAGFRRTSSDANAATGPYTGRLRDIARDLVRNTPYAEAALATIVDDTVGTGIVPTPRENKAAAKTWAAWANTTTCDADGRHDFAGLEQAALRAIAQDGEVLVRRRVRLPKDGLPLPIQIQILEADYLDTTKHGITLPNGGRIVYGVEFDAIGRRVAYWLFPEHPGSSMWSTAASQRVPADGVIHVFRSTRPGAVRGPSWFAPVILKMKDFDDFEDATLVKQKIAACLAVITTDVDGSAPALGTADDTTSPGIDALEPGMVINAPAGRGVEVVQPPSVGEYSDYTSNAQRAIASGIGITFEDLTGNYARLPFSAARMSRLRYWKRVEGWRWRMLVPQFCIPVWGWVMQAAVIVGKPASPTAEWTAPPPPMIEPDKEGLAYQRNIRTGIQSLSEAIRERGYDPEVVFQEMAADNKRLDQLGLLLDSDPRRMTQAGQMQSAGTSGDGAKPKATPKPKTETKDGDEGETNED